MHVYFITITEGFIFNPLIFVSTLKDVAYIHASASIFILHIYSQSFSSALI